MGELTRAFFIYMVAFVVGVYTALLSCIYVGYSLGGYPFVFTAIANTVVGVSVTRAFHHYILWRTPQDKKPKK